MDEENTTPEQPDDITDLDIDAALESVASLSDAIAEQEAEEQAEAARVETEEREAEQAIARREAYYLPRPPMLRTERGKLSSVVPAFLLMAFGAGLTFLLGAPDASLDPSLLILIALGGLGTLMIAQWMASGRWAGGALFGGLTILTGVGMLVFLANGPGATGWPLLLVALGISILLSGILSQALSRYQPLLGLAFIVAGGVGYVITAGLIDIVFEDYLPVFYGVLGVFLALILVSPLILRRQD
jgi:hypothetical protein